MRPYDVVDVPLADDQRHGASGVARGYLLQDTVLLPWQASAPSNRMHLKRERGWVMLHQPLGAFG